MKYCRYCGKEVYDDAVICVNCGRDISEKAVQKDTGNVGWAFLGFFVPIVGLILYLIWKDERPKDAKRAGIGALISVAVGIAVSILYLIFFFILIAGFSTTNFVLTL